MSASVPRLGGQQLEIDENQVEQIATLLRDRFRNTAPQQASWNDPTFWNIEASREERCQFLAIGNSINFRFWSIRNAQIIPAIGFLDGIEYRGSMYLWRRLRLALAHGEFSLEADFLRSITEEQFKKAFTDEHDKFPLEPGLGERVANLADLGAVLVERWNGQFAHVIDAAEGSLEKFVALCASFRAFDDPLEKLTMVNAIMLIGSGLAAFDKDPRPGIDYHLVKQAVRQGLVVPPPSIRSKLANDQLLDTDEALALRRATLDALLTVANHANISPAAVDNLYWLNRRVCDETNPACMNDDDPRCPFETVCLQRTELGLPLELTRYY